MAKIAFDDILSSKPFRFLIGPQKREFFLHAALAASQSSALDSLVNGSMKEAASGCTVWQAVDEETFIRFGQYVYTENYEGAAPSTAASREASLRRDWGGSKQECLFPAPAAEQSEAAEPEASESAAEVSNDWVSGLRKSSLKKNRKKKACFSSWDTGSNEEGADPAPVAQTMMDGPPQPMNSAWTRFKTDRSYECGVAGPHFCPSNNDSQSEYGDVFLSHARVHMMANYYNMQPLAQLALHKLHQTLCKFTLHDERMCDVVALLRYCYDEDERPLLRELVSAYAACHAKRLWTNMEFQEVFAAHGELSRAMMGDLVGKLQ